MPLLVLLFLCLGFGLSSSLEAVRRRPAREQGLPRHQDRQGGQGRGRRRVQEEQRRAPLIHRPPVARNLEQNDLQADDNNRARAIRNALVLTRFTPQPTPAQSPQVQSPRVQSPAPQNNQQNQ